MAARRNWKSLQEFIGFHQRFLITTHIHPDGDAIGSQLALASYLDQQGKQAVLINCESTPKFFKFLDPQKRIEIFHAGRHNHIIQSCDGAFVVDISDWARLKEVGMALKKYKTPIACIDHHIPTDLIADVEISDTQVSSTGELLYEFFRKVKAHFDATIVDALYTSILTDTGSFRFSNTTPRTHQIAADLIRRGARFQDIYRNAYENDSKNRAQLRGRLMADIKFECNDRLAWFALTQNLINDYGVELWETEGFSELPRSIENVEISLMFTEGQNGTTKISFRSKGTIPVNQLAGQLGGGGHKFASGATVKQDLETTISQVVHNTKKLIAEYKLCKSEN
ncbi:bifunctional oligoribonuclease/PAP phosphatase NrnA [candidate division KSB1 bacterium]|nr:bifunctional oligoribonuclease/PAP phosphatase NrnA [candidate division KSB1 bacterium]